ncbi:UxaA family hydrolase [Oceaniglobus trochenteri]|uniref:UxaA family hydrolase n=1 Tax=Oceaniglobus trochenteri TaxID=2763260 RepID=UPI001CFFFD49|nr:UxaA family hydrolase [Oceaniglobus trochenteri]
MTISAMQLHPDDTVACLLRDHRAGAPAQLVSGATPVLTSDVALGHKIALVPIAKGEAVVKYGAVIGHATADIAPGDHVHLHNLRGKIG